MKANTVLLLICLSFSIVAPAQIDDRGKEIELEQDTLQIHDLEAERKNALAEALRQEKEKAHLENQLKVVTSQKASILEKAKRDIALAEARRITSESAQKVYQAQITKIKQESKKLEDHSNAALMAAKKAEDTAQAGRSELENQRTIHEKLVQLLKQRANQLNESQVKMQKMRKEYQSLKTDNKKLEQNLKRLPSSQN